MFESAEVGSQVGKAEYKREAPKIRTALLAAQKKLATAPLSVVIVVGGVEGAGKSETVNLLLGWMDPRGIRVHAMWEPTDEENERPPMWRFWRLLPPKRTMGIFFGSWYSMPIVDRVFNRIDDAAFDQALDRIAEFERMLHQEDTLVIKFWMHLSQQQQKKRLKQLEKDPLQRWRVSKMDWKFFKKYDNFQRVSERAIRRTSTGEAPWYVVEAKNEHFRNLTITKTVLGALEERLASIEAKKPAKPVPELPKPKKVNIINQLDLTKKLSDAQFERQLLDLQGRINLKSRHLYEQKKSLILVFEGPDAAGKGGAIRRLLSAMDARNYEVISVAAPTDEEFARPYLWRFWRHLPRLGRTTIFDRSWYGRVLVERIEGFCARQDWQRAYAEINSFEEQMADFGTILIKFWMTVSPEEQLRRFKDRETTPYKQYKLTEEDWRNREKWDAYVAAACDMIERTSTEEAPWVLVEANDKNHARIKVMKTVARALEKALK
jgi:polyphosphate:AMP phosphotransferase